MLQRVGLLAERLMQQYFEPEETAQLHAEISVVLREFCSYYGRVQDIELIVARLLAFPLGGKWMNKNALSFIIRTMYELRDINELEHCFTTLLRTVEHDESDYGASVITSLTFLSNFKLDPLVWQHFEDVLQCICGYYAEWKEKYHDKKLIYLCRMQGLVRTLALMTQEERRQSRHMQMVDFILQTFPIGIDDETKQYALDLIGSNQLTMTEVVSCAKRCENCVDHVKDHIDAWRCLLSIEQNMCERWRCDSVERTPRESLCHIFNTQTEHGRESHVRDVIDRVAQMLREQKWYDLDSSFVEHISPAPVADIERTILFAMPSKTFAHASWNNIEAVMEFMRAFDPHQYKRVFDCLDVLFSKKNLQEDEDYVIPFLYRMQDLCRYQTDAGEEKYDIERVASTLCFSQRVWKYLEICKEEQIVHVMNKALPEFVVKDIVSYLNFFVPIDRKHEIFDEVHHMIESRSQRVVSLAMTADADRFAECILRIKRSRDGNMETFANRPRLTSYLQQQPSLSGCKRENGNQETLHQKKRR